VWFFVFIWVLLIPGVGQLPVLIRAFVDGVPTALGEWLVVSTVVAAAVIERAIVRLLDKEPPLSDRDTKLMFACIVTNAVLMLFAVVIYGMRLGNPSSSGMLEISGTYLAVTVSLGFVVVLKSCKPTIAATPAPSNPAPPSGPSAPSANG
jgi:branched-subunit amino acid ABC-type transport system permease component